MTDTCDASVELALSQVQPDAASLQQIVATINAPCECEEDYVCDAELRLLGQLARLLTEATALFPAVVANAMRLDDLDTALRGAALFAREAYSAASMLNQRAPLARSWAAGPSRPRGIRGRHFHAVSEGHTPVTPAPVPEAIQAPREPQLAARAIPRDARPQCAGTTQAGAQCKNPVIVFDDGSTASRCGTHLQGEEREHRILDRGTGSRDTSRYIGAIAMQWLVRDFNEIRPEGPINLAEIPESAQHPVQSIDDVAPLLNAAVEKVEAIGRSVVYKDRIDSLRMPRMLSPVVEAFSAIEAAGRALLAPLGPSDDWVLEHELVETVAGTACDELAAATNIVRPHIVWPEGTSATSASFDPDALTAAIKRAAEASWCALHALESATDAPLLREAIIDASEHADAISDLVDEDQDRRAERVRDLTTPLDSE